MKEHCAYHPTRPALWHCPECDGHFCPDCVSHQSLGPGTQKSMTLCPKCNLPLKRLGISSMIEPFWNRLPAFFAYPFQVRSLVLMLVLAVIVAALYTGESRFMSGILALIAILVMQKYSFAALRRTAHGDLTPPEISQETVSDDIHVVFMVWVFYSIILSISFVTMGTVNIAFGIFVWSILMLLYPSMIMVLATGNSVLAAMNPANFIRLASRMGKGYLIMYFFFQTLQAAPMVILWALGQYLPVYLSVFLYILAMNYYTLVTFHLMGYAILQYHEEIGYHVEFEDRFIEASQKKTSARPENTLMNRVNICIKDGKIKEAIGHIAKETKGEIHDLELSEKYYSLLRADQRTTEVVEHGRRHLEALSRAGMKDKMLEVYRECLEIDPQFNPAGQVTLKIADKISSSGDPKEAVNMLNRFIKENPHDGQVPYAYLLAANIISTRLMNPQKAATILYHLTNTYPNHEVAVEASQHLQKLRLSHGIT